MSEEKLILNHMFEAIETKFDEKERLAVVDVFLQFSQNPTSMSTGYGIEENYNFIGENLRKGI